MPESPEFQSCLVTASRFSGQAARPGRERESWVENRHQGWAVATDLRQGHLYCTPGAGEIATFFRSAAKPFQAFPLAAVGADLPAEELAIACASHVASACHLSQVQALLDKAGLPESALQCGPHEPIDADMRRQLTKTGQAPTAIHNNCSGKHAGMLLASVRTGYDPGTYLDPAHPLQQSILETLQQWGDVRDIPVAVDGCGAPVFYMPLSAMARLYALLGQSDVFARIRDAMTGHPDLVGGEGRIDTALMQASQGTLLAKVGADGLIGISRVGEGQGLILKIGDGNTDIRNLAIVELLLHLGWLNQQAAAHPALAAYRRHERMNTQDRVIGEYRFHFQNVLQALNA